MSDTEKKPRPVKTRGEHLTLHMQGLMMMVRNIETQTKPATIIAHGGATNEMKLFYQILRNQALLAQGVAVAIDSLFALEIAAGTAELPAPGTKVEPEPN